MKMSIDRRLTLATFVIQLCALALGYLLGTFLLALAGCAASIDYRGMMLAEQARCQSNTAAILGRENSTLEVDERDLLLEEHRCHDAEARICAASARAAEQPEGCVPHESTDEPEPE